MPSVPFAVPLTPLVLTGTCVDAIVLASPFVGAWVVPFERGTAEGMAISYTALGGTQKHANCRH